MHALALGSCGRCVRACSGATKGDYDAENAKCEQPCGDRWPGIGRQRFAQTPPPAGGAGGAAGAHKLSQAECEAVWNKAAGGGG